MITVASNPMSPAWNVELFKNFWNNPSVAAARQGCPAVISDDIVGVWPHGTVLRGRDQYVDGLVRLLTAIPDLQAHVKEYASSGEFRFVRWEATGTYEGAPFVVIGTDRVRLRDNLVAENLVMSDHPLFKVVAPT